MNDTLKLAAECEQSATLPTSLYAEAAAELRRLHELAESEGRWASDYLQRAVKAEAINAKLLEALEDMLGWQTLAPDGVVAAARAAIEQYDQTSLELCNECGWKALIPGDGCLVCARQKAKPVWVELTDDEARALVNRATFGDKTNWQALVYMVDAKLRERNV
jgi:hypothetical protein